MPIFTCEEREQLRSKLVLAAEADSRIIAAAHTGSGAAGTVDRWSDIDLALSLAPDAILDTSEVVVPLVTKAGVQWHGWHAFRRGLATNLHQLGVSDNTIQRILRQYNVAVTQSCYIKTVDCEVTSAMQQLEHSLDYAPKMHLSGTPRERLM